jgi:hypothetical protein
MGAEIPLVGMAAVVAVVKASDPKNPAPAIRNTAMALVIRRSGERRTVVMTILWGQLTALRWAYSTRVSEDRQQVN